MKILHKPKFIYFDGMNVLVDKNKPESFYISKELGFPEERYEEYINAVARKQSKEMQDEFWTVSSLEKEREYMNKYHIEFLKFLNITYNKELVEKLTKLRMEADYFVKDGVKQALETLSKKYRLGVLTNAMPSRRYHELKLDNIDKYFEHIVISREVGSFKPDHKIYEVAIERSGLSPEDILFIDDKVKYLDGAVAAGIKNVLLMKHKEETDKYPMVSNLLELEQMLDEKAFIKTIK